MIQRGPSSFDPSAVAGQTLDTPLSRILADRIGSQGPISFADWMDACLYHPQHGYYRRGKPTVGRDGDFLTSPEVHPIFGAAVGHVALELWRNIGRVGQFEIAEVGPGTGALAESMFRHLHSSAPELAATCRFSLVEPDAAAAAQQADRLRACLRPDQIEFIPHLDALRDGYHLVVANELLDALPVHRLIFNEGAWRELHVDHSTARGFHEVLVDSRTPQLVQPLKGVAAAEQQIVEVAPERASVVTRLARATGERGLLLLLDYGYSRDRLYASWRRDGTLMTFRNHIPGDDPFRHPGEQDITAHIDVDQVRDAAQASGLTPLPTLSQAEWLQQMGAALMPAVADAEMETGRYLAARRAIESLTDSAGLGRIAVMGFSRGSVGVLPGWSAS